MGFKAYLFDFDGTLVDSMPSWSAKMISVLDTFGANYPSDIIKILTPLGDKGSAKYFREVIGIDRTDEEMFEIMDAYALPKYRDEIPFKDGVKDYLEKLKKAGISINVLTASPHKMLDPCLKRLGVFDWFDNVWSCDDFATTKADPEIYVKAAKAIGVDVDKVAFFDDNIGAVKTAKSAGMYTVAVEDASAKDFKDELIKVADSYIESFNGAQIF